MKRKATGNLGLRIAGWVLCGMALLWLILGAVMYSLPAEAFSEPEEETRLVGLIFMGLGGVLMLIGLPMLLTDGRIRRRNRRLLEEGTCYEAQVINLYYAGAQVNHRQGLVFECKYTDAAGSTHLVKSAPQYRMALLGGPEDYRVLVWVDPYESKHYYVEITNTAIAEGKFDYDDR